MSNLLWSNPSPSAFGVPAPAPAAWTPPTPNQMKLELLEQLLLATREDLLRVKVDLASALRRLETLEQAKVSFSTPAQTPRPVHAA
jgi:hypothetical protein